MRPPTLRSPDSPVGGGRPLTGAHLSPRAGSEGQRSSPHSHVPPQAPHSPHSSQRSPAAGFNLADFSSSQTLLNLVRTHAQSSQLETYLKGAVKRPASSTQEGTNKMAGALQRIVLLLKYGIDMYYVYKNKLKFLMATYPFRQAHHLTRFYLNSIFTISTVR